MIENHCHPLNGRKLGNWPLEKSKARWVDLALRFQVLGFRLKYELENLWLWLYTIWGLYHRDLSLHLCHTGREEQEKKARSLLDCYFLTNPIVGQRGNDTMMKRLWIRHSLLSSRFKKCSCHSCANTSFWSQEALRGVTSHRCLCCELASLKFI